MSGELKIFFRAQVQCEVYHTVLTYLKCGKSSLCILTILTYGSDPLCHSYHTYHTYHTYLWDSIMPYLPYLLMGFASFLLSILPLPSLRTYLHTYLLCYSALSALRGSAAVRQQINIYIYILGQTRPYTWTRMLFVLGYTCAFC